MKLKFLTKLSMFSVIALLALTMSACGGGGSKNRSGSDGAIGGGSGQSDWDSLVWDQDSWS